MKFIADGMLGRLTRWLRLAGQDVVSVNDCEIKPSEEDDFLLGLARKDSRYLLTRDVDLYRRALREDLKAILIREEGDVAKQMFTVSDSLEEPIDVDIGSSRCPVCNGELKSIDKSSVSKEIPVGVFQDNEEFWLCESCGKIYWPGSHWKKIAETVKRYKDMRG